MSLAMNFWSTPIEFVTNFSEDQMAIFQEALRRYREQPGENKAFLEIRQWYSLRLEDELALGGSLWNYSSRQDLCDFWDVFEAVKQDRQLSVEIAA